MPIPPAVIAGVAQGVGGLLAGRKRAGEARVSRRAVDAKMEEAINYAKRMNKREGGKAGGLNLVKLRNDALKAGFNPLTVLNATGGAGYDRVMSPFGDVASMMVHRAELVGQMSGAAIETAGYLGDAISAGAGAYFSQRNTDTANALDAARTAAIAGVGRSGGGGGGGAGYQVVSPYTAPVVTPGVSGKQTFFQRLFGSVSDFGRDFKVDDFRDFSPEAVMTDQWGNTAPLVNPDLDMDIVGDVINGISYVGVLGAKQWLNQFGSWARSMKLPGTKDGYVGTGTSGERYDFSKLKNNSAGGYW